MREQLFLRSTQSNASFAIRFNLECDEENLLHRACQQRRFKRCVRLM